MNLMEYFMKKKELLKKLITTKRKMRTIYLSNLIIEKINNASKEHGIPIAKLFRAVAEEPYDPSYYKKYIHLSDGEKSYKNINVEDEIMDLNKRESAVHQMPLHEIFTIKMAFAIEILNQMERGNNG